MSKSVNLTIKSPVSEETDLSLKAELDWSVGQIKEVIQSTMTHHPSPSHQRLVYGGKLLDNDAILEEFLRFDDDQITSHVLHLILKETGCLRNRRNPGSSIESSSVSPSSSETPNTIPPSPFSNHSLDQAYWMHHAYIEYMNQYMQYMSQYPGGGGGGFVSDRLTTPETNPEPQREANQPMRILGEEEEGRDALDHFYVGSRIIFFIIILYFYSTFTRLAFVITLFVLVHLYQSGVFGQRRQGIVENNPQQEQQQQQQQQGDDDNQVPETENVTNNEPPRINILEITRTFITTFFTSLIPEQIHVN